MPLISLLIITTLLFSTSFTPSFCDGVSNITFTSCDKTFSCGSISNVTYPFTGGDRPDHCGLPEFKLTCQSANNVTELTHNSITYRVLQLNQTLKKLTLSRSDLYNNTCPSRFLNSTLNSNFFSFDDQDDDPLTLIYGCNSSVMSMRPQNLFSCSIPKFNFTDAYFIVGPIPSDPILRFIHCSVSVTVPMLRSAGARLTGNGTSLTKALMEGFSVNYSDPYENVCSECTRFGGQCGFDSNSDQPVCICGDKLCPLPPPSEESQNASTSVQAQAAGNVSTPVSIGAASF